MVNFTKYKPLIIDLVVLTSLLLTALIFWGTIFYIIYHSYPFLKVQLSFLSIVLIGLYSILFISYLNNKKL
jgi:hypothetical protein